MFLPTVLSLNHLGTLAKLFSIQITVHVGVESIKVRGRCGGAYGTSKVSFIDHFVFRNTLELRDFRVGLEGYSLRHAGI